MKVVIGGMTGSAFRISAIGHLLPLLNCIDMDGRMLIKNDIANGVKVQDEKVYFPDRNGTGAELLRYLKI